ncbi:MAG: hypothetical protein QME75_15665, partial [Deltaproteobacteria bacterium]|nr:hypothetical protein [Desulfitobacteriaceae bacterium]MDI6855031.1 hypothetical protein [Deltaproteobacteria bacterium]
LEDLKLKKPLFLCLSPKTENAAKQTVEKTRFCNPEPCRGVIYHALKGAINCALPIILEDLKLKKPLFLCLSPKTENRKPLKEAVWAADCSISVYPGGLCSFQLSVFRWRDALRFPALR